MIILGLTGSIGMGKTTVAGFFEAEGVPVCDSDALVRALYTHEAKAALIAAFPDCVRGDEIDRALLRARAFTEAEVLKRLEAILHPLVRAGQEAFLASHRAKGTKMAVLDIPLLFETGAQARCDATLLVSVGAEIQRARVLAREGMTPAFFEAIRARQWPDAEKRRLADFLIITDGSKEDTHKKVREIIRQLLESKR